MAFLDSIFSNNKIKKHAIIIDVGSESVGVVFVEIKNGEEIIIVESARKIIPFQENINIDRFLSFLCETVTSALESFKTPNINNFETTVLVSLSSPWATTQTKVLNIIEEEEFVITDGGLSDIISKESELFLENRKLSLNKKGYVSSNLIECKISQIRINGYEVEMPIGKKTNNLNLSIHIATAPDIVINKLTDLIKNKYSNSNIIFHSFMFSAYNSIRDIYHETTTYISLDIAGEVTEITYVKNGAIAESMAYPIGYRSFVRQVSVALKLPGDLAESEINLYFDSKLSLERSAQIKQCILSITEKWSDLFVESIRHLSKNHPIPKDIFLLSETLHLDHFKNAIISSSPSVFDLENELFNVIIVDQEKLSASLFGDPLKCKDLYFCVTILMLDKLLSTPKQHNNKYICKKI